MRIRDVIHGDIDINEDIFIDLIETKEFQRLRNIKQIGLSYVSFPTAEHSRFSHSIGVYHLATRMIDVLENKTNIDLDDSDCLSLRIACLLHDVGHGAFSHTSEEFFGFNHEQYSIDIIKSSDTQINQVLNKYNPNLIDTVVSFIKKDHPHNILNEILSGTVDVDRMDYLLRDSYFAGVKYGEVDIDRLFNVIDIKENQLVFHEKGLKAVEDFIMSRYNMFSQVYLNKKALAYEVLVREILAELKKLSTTNLAQLPNGVNKLLPFFNNQVSVKDYLLVDDMVFINLINDLANLDTYNYELDYVVMLAKAFVNKKITFKKEKANLKYSFNTSEYKKKIYNESVKIYTEDKQIKNLEDCSELTMFLKEKVAITMNSKEFYIKND